MEAELTFEGIQEKLDKGETLSQEEEKFIMSEPHDDMNVGGPAAPAEDEEGAFDDMENIGEGEEKEKEETSDAEGKKDEDSEKEKEGEKEADTSKAKEKDETTSEEDEIDQDKVERELLKPEGQEDLGELSKVEKGLFWNLRRERRARQNLEEENARLKHDVLKKKEDVKTGDEDEGEGEKDDSDFVTVADAKKMLESAKTGKPGAVEFYQTQLLRMHDVVARSEVGKSDADDYDEVIECAPEIIDTSDLYQRKVVEAMGKGENTALVIYHLIKGDPQFPKVVEVARARLKAAGRLKEDKKETSQETDEDKRRKVDEAKRKEQKLKENKDKPKTSGHFSGGDTSSGEGELSLQQIARMPFDDWMKIPKAKRDYYTEKYG